MNFKKYLLILAGMILPVFLIVIPESRGTTQYTGTETCIECHDTYGDIESTPHMRSFSLNGTMSSRGCESCHGPGAGHAESGDSEDILSFGNRSLITQNLKNEACLKCHENGKMALWQSSEHNARGVSCSDCHKAHIKNEANLADERKITPDNQCIKCHARIKGQLMRQSHHPIHEGKMKCQDCHNPHGTIADKLIDAQQANLKCFECHEEKRGPFLWEHPAVTEECLTCHAPHGSTHSPLLETKAPYLCQRCHSDENHAGTLYAKNPDQMDQSIYQTGPNYVFYRACLNCHVSIHGSNHPSGKSLLR